MNHLFLSAALFVLILAAPSGPTWADSHFITEHYDQCILENMPGVKLNGVADEIKRICKETHSSRWSLSKKKQQYNQCLLVHLKDVESYKAANEISNACRAQFLE
ncbi:MAG: hypothetical protein ACU833_11545 [Gammaproteobacteria bacterium]